MPNIKTVLVNGTPFTAKTLAKYVGISVPAASTRLLRYSLGKINSAELFTLPKRVERIGGGMREITLMQYRDKSRYQQGNGGAV